MAYLEPLDPSDRAGMGYRRIKRRSGRGLAALLAVVVMAGSASALWLAYRVSSRDAVPESVPLIHADARPTKIRPEEPGGMQIPNQDRLVFSQLPGPASVEKLLPPPETPLPRPVPPQDSLAEAAPSAAPPPPAAPTGPSGTALPPPAAPPSAAMAMTPLAPTASPPPQIAVLPNPSAPSPDRRGYRLQLGSVRTPEGAKQEWDRLKRLNSDLLGALGFTAERAALGERGTFYRIQAGPIADSASAERICGELRHRNIGCILVKP